MYSVLSFTLFLLARIKSIDSRTVGQLNNCYYPWITCQSSSRNCIINCQANPEDLQLGKMCKLGGQIIPCYNSQGLFGTHWNTGFLSGSVIPAWPPSLALPIIPAWVIHQSLRPSISQTNLPVLNQPMPLNKNMLYPKANKVHVAIQKLIKKKDILNKEHLVHCNKTGFLPFEGNCQDFFVCNEDSNGQIISDGKYRCPRGFLFDVFQSCCRPESLVNCQHFSLDGNDDTNVIEVHEDELKHFFVNINLVH